MKNYNCKKDLKVIREIFSLTQEQFAQKVGVSRSNILRYESGAIFPHKSSLERIYSFCLENDFNLNKAKVMLFMDNAKDNKLLFHGAKEEIKDTISINHLIGKKDFGAGFYLGESFESAASWIAEWPNGSIYSFYLDTTDLKILRFDVGMEWMLAILYFRGMFEKYEINATLLEIINKIEQADVIVAPIADNQMYETLNSFAFNQISDEQCLHALSANNLGYQYVIKSKKALKGLKQIERHYLCQIEKNKYLSIKRETSLDGRNKALLSINKYRRKGRYFDEIFKKLG